MSDPVGLLSPPPEAPAAPGPDLLPAPPSPGTSPLTRKLLAVLLFAGTIAAAAGLGWLTSAPPAGPTDFDPRVADLARFVESERGLDFLRPVPVDFLSEEQYRSRVNDDRPEPTADERREYETMSEVGRALGLLAGEVDLLAEGDDLVEGGTLAYYDPAQRRIVVRGTELTPGLRGTLVHELTHALQDQHFEITRDFASDGAATAFTALLEGDAMRLEERWSAQLDGATWDAYRAEGQASYDDAVTDVAAVPELLRASFGAPYSLGPALVEVLLAEGGQERLDEAFESPPTSEVHLLDPLAFLAGRETVDVDPPRLSKGDRRLQHQEFGALTLYLMLSSQLPPAEALDVADGWTGDAAVAFSRDNRTCVAAWIAGRSDADTGRITSGLERWAAAHVAASPTVTRDGRRVRLVTCDPGPEAPAPPVGWAERAVSVSAARATLMSSAFAEHEAPRFAGCYAQRAIEEFGPEELTGQAAPVDVDARLEGVARTCR